VLSEEFQDLSDMFDVVLLVSTVDQDVINVDNDGNVEEGSKNILNQRLKSSWGIGESKRHNLVLVVAISSAKCCLWDVILMDSNLVVARTEINLGEYLGFIETVYQIINEWDGESILDGDLVECSVVNAHVEFSIFLFDEDDQGSIWALAWFDGSILQEFV